LVITAGSTIAAPATVWAVFDIDLEYALEQAG